MDNKIVLPMIVFLTVFILLIIVLLVLQNKRRKKFKHTIEELDYEKNKLIGVPILSELSKVRDLVKTDDLKQKLNEWDETFKDIKGILYLNKEVNSITSKEIVIGSLPYVRSRIIADLDKVKLPIIYRECARLYYVSNMTPDELAIMYKCTVALIYKRLRMVANAIFVSNYGNIVNNAI